MTRFENRIDSLTELHNKRSLESMLSGKAFIAGTSKKRIDEAIQQQKILSSIRYKENRARISFQHYKNEQLLPSTNKEPELDSAGTTCNCYFDGDTLRITTGVWLFSGLSVHVDIVGNKFKGGYHIDDHDRKALKLKNSDKLTGVIIIPLIEQQLILDTSPDHRMGQQLNGYLVFKTATYLRAADFEDWSIKEEYSEKDMDLMHTKGVVHFTCKIRQKLIYED